MSLGDWELMLYFGFFIGDSLFNGMVIYICLLRFLEYEEGGVSNSVEYVYLNLYIYFGFKFKC